MWVAGNTFLGMVTFPSSPAFPSILDRPFNSLQKSETTRSVRKSMNFSTRNESCYVPITDADVLSSRSREEKANKPQFTVRFVASQWALVVTAEAKIWFHQTS